MAKIQRTFGWIQNPGELSKLRKVVASLCPNTSFRTMRNKYPFAFGDLKSFDET